MSKQLRLLKVAVTPVFVVDDGEQLTELTLNPPTVVVPAQEWPGFATGRFKAIWDELEEQVRQNFVQPSIGASLGDPLDAPDDRGAPEVPQP